MQSRRLSGAGVAVAGLPRYSWLVVLAGAFFVARCLYVGGWLAAQGMVPSASVPLAENRKCGRPDGISFCLTVHGEHPSILATWRMSMASPKAWPCASTFY